VDCVVGHRPCLEPATTHGFLVSEAEVTFWGTCPECQNSIPLRETDRDNISSEPTT